MNLRLPNSMPFHLRVKFHAFPGLELLPPDRTEILSGNGVYEETWLSQDRWRREVSLGSYHAIETQFGDVRKMKATSDYVPSRVIMLMDALLNPISRYNMSEELGGHRHWKKKVVVGSEGHTMTRISSADAHTNLLDLETDYIFLPAGTLVMSRESDIVITREDDVHFGGKVFPRHIVVQASASRNLLSADLLIEPAGSPDPSIFNISGDPAEPGMTLRPIQPWMVKGLSETVYPPAVNTLSVLPDLLIRINITRQGFRRDVEIISIAGRNSTNPLQGAAEMLASARQARYHPGSIDGSSCQVQWEQFAAASTGSLAQRWK